MARKTGSLIHPIEIDPSAFGPEVLLRDGIDLHRVLVELLRLVRRQGLLLLPSDQPENLYRIVMDQWSEKNLRAIKQKSIEEFDRLMKELAELPKKTEQTNIRDSWNLRGNDGKDGMKRRRLEADVTAARLTRDRAERLPVEICDYYVQALAEVADEGRLLPLPSARIDSIAELKVAAEPDLQKGVVALRSLPNGDSFRFLSVGDHVVPKTVAGYRESVGLIIQSARQRIAFVDPYLASLADERTRYLSFLHLVFTEIAERSSSLPPVELVFHAAEMGNETNSGHRYKLLMSHAGKDRKRNLYIQDLHHKMSATIRRCYHLALKDHPELEERLQSIHVCYWVERYKFRQTHTGRTVDADLIGERFHDRYLLADHTGVEFPYGLDCREPDEGDVTPTRTILKLLSREVKEKVEERFTWSSIRSKRLPYESFNGPMEVTVKK